jgi:hypothetical protein
MTSYVENERRNERGVESLSHFGLCFLGREFVRSAEEPAASLRRGDRTQVRTKYDGGRGGHHMKDKV